jgi:hypothetical protein
LSVAKRLARGASCAAAVAATNDTTPRTRTDSRRNVTFHLLREGPSLTEHPDARPPFVPCAARAGRQDGVVGRPGSAERLFERLRDSRLRRAAMEYAYWGRRHCVPPRPIAAARRSVSTAGSRVAPRRVGRVLHSGRPLTGRERHVPRTPGDQKCLLIALVASGVNRQEARNRPSTEERLCSHTRLIHGFESATILFSWSGRQSDRTRACSDASECTTARREARVNRASRLPSAKSGRGIRRSIIDRAAA